MKTVAIFEHPVLGTAVSGRAVYNAIALGSSKSTRDVFSDWFRQREEKFKLKEGVDFITVRSNTGFTSPTGRTMIEFVITLSVAKQFATFQLAGRGKALLQYFAEYEQKPTQEPSAEPAGVIVPTLSFDAPAAAIEPLPVMPAVSENISALSPAQQLLQQAQKLVEQEQANQSNNSQYGERLVIVEGKLDLLTKLFQSAVAALTGAVPVAEEVSSPVRRPETTRSKLTRMVDSYAMATGKIHKQVWRSLYGALHLTSHFDALAVADNDKDSYLDVVEKHGYMDSMYDLASKRLTVGQA